jgi:dTDP-4-dehydrorhamnose reductase
MSTMALAPGESAATCNRCSAKIVFPSADAVWPSRWNVATERERERGR